MKKIVFISTTLLCIGAVFAFTLIHGWQIAGNYNIAFSSNDASGVFKTFKGSVVFDEKNLAAAKFDVVVESASISTGSDLQDEHAKSEEWFDVTKYPQIKYSSDAFTKTATGYQVSGMLDMHGVKKQVLIPFTFSKAAVDSGTFIGSFTVNRNDFKIGKPGKDVGEVIKIDLSVPVTAR
jgi:polyisoprenoid-binding protein YceI